MASKLEESLAAQLDIMGRDERWPWPSPVRELRFAPPRRWRFDFAWPDQMVAVECEGIVYGRAGRHQTGAGYEADLLKYAAAQEAGWVVLRVSQRMVTSGQALHMVESALKRTKSPDQAQNAPAGTSA